MYVCMYKCGDDIHIYTPPYPFGVKQCAGFPPQFEQIPEIEESLGILRQIHTQLLVL
jgi:hypothetical protein